MPAFVVTLANGPQWDPSRGRREQARWESHASYMDRLLADGFVVLGGPIDDGHQVMLVVEADDEATVRATLAADPWAGTILEVASIRAWDLWLDGRADVSR